MRDAVTVSAFRELGQHCCRVGGAVTALALGHHLVFSLMAGYAAQFLVFEFAGQQQFVGFLVAAGAVLGRGFLIIDNVLRHVCLVTLFAVGSGLFGEVRFMALGAFRNPAVGVVARAAEECRMLALVIAQLDDLTGMAGHAGVGNVIAEYDRERSVGIRVAAVASSQLVVRFPFVALAAERDNLPGCGRVPVVAVLAADLRFVFAACCSDVGRSLAVAFDAVIIKQLRGLNRWSSSRCQILRLRRDGGCRIGGVDHALNSEKGKSSQQSNPYSFRLAAFFHWCCLLDMMNTEKHSNLLSKKSAGLSHG
jgi:uncharacterized membrane protein (DUF485 family)